MALALPCQRNTRIAMVTQAPVRVDAGKQAAVLV